MTDTAVKAIENLDVPDNGKKGLMPVTIEATIVETEAGNATLRFIGDVLDSSKDDLTKTLSDEILKDRQKAAATAASEAADALEKLRQEEEAAYTEFLKADAELKALAPASTPAEIAARQVKEFELERTKRLWCVKFTALQKNRRRTFWAHRHLPVGTNGCSSHQSSNRYYLLDLTSS